MSSIPCSLRAIKVPQFSLLPFSCCCCCFSLKPSFSISAAGAAPPSSTSISHVSSFKSKSFHFQRLSQSRNASSSSSSSSIEPIEGEGEGEGEGEAEAEFPPKLEEIIKLFQAVEDPRAKYQQLLFYANKIPPLDDSYKTKENKVQGCVSQVWVRAFLGHPPSPTQPPLVYFQADSDSLMTKGLAALLVLGLSGSPVPHVLRVSPHFITLLGLHHSLSPSRNNGFLNMFKLMQQKALLLGLEGAHSRTSNPDLNEQEQEQEQEQVQVVGSSTSSTTENGPTPAAAAAAVAGSALGRRGERIKEVLEKELKPVELEIEDVSHQHAGHRGVKPTHGEAETHFNLKIVSDEFQGKSLVKRHRIIYGLLQHELDTGLHALSILANTPAEIHHHHHRHDPT